MNGKNEISSSGILLSIIVVFLLLQFINAIQYSKKQEMPANLVQCVRFPRKSGIYVFKLDGHEYIYVVDRERSGICHKADCSFCKKELK